MKHRKPVEEMSVAELEAEIREGGERARREMEQHVARAIEDAPLRASLDALRADPAWREPDVTESDGKRLVMYWQGAERKEQVTLRPPSQPAFQHAAKIRDAVEVHVLPGGSVEVVKLSAGLPFEACRRADGFADALAWLSSRGAA